MGGRLDAASGVAYNGGMGRVLHLAGKVGAVFTDSCRTAGAVFLLLGDTLRSMVQYRLRWDQIFEQMYFIGIRSQVVVLTTGAFTGAVFAAQVWFQFKRFGMESAIGPTVSIRSRYD